MSTRTKKQAVVEAAVETSTHPPVTPIRVSRDNLAAGMSQVKPVIGRGALYALSHVLLEAEGEQLRLTGTNLSIWISAVVPIQGSDAAWKLAVPAHTLDEVLRVLPPESVLTATLEEGNQMRLTTDRTTTHLKGLPADDFPLMPSLTPAQQVALPAAAWNQCLAQVLPAVAKDDGRPVLTNLNLETDDGGLLLTATDAMRLARTRQPLSLTQDVACLLSRQTAQLLTRVGAKHEGDVLFALDEAQNQLFTVGGTVIFAAGSEGSFPNVMPIVDSAMTNVASTVTLAREPLAQALRLVGVMMPSSKQMAVQFEDEGSELKLWANDAEVGDTQQVMPAQIAGPGLKLVLNGDYLRDAVAACVGESVVLRASPSPKAAIICGGDDMDAGYHLIMPMVDHA